MSTILLDGQTTRMPLESATISHSLLSEEQLAFLNENGYVALPEITSDEEIVELRQIISGLFEKKAGYDQGAYFNFAGAEEDKDGPSIPQIVGPHHFAHQLKRTEFRRNAAAVARQILGPQARFHVDHTMTKPPLVGAATPWHQDEAFKDPRFKYREISIWMPLQPVNDLNGCMQFIPGTHTGKILPHRNPNHDARVHALECYEGFDPAQAVACPLPAGGCTIHFGRTVHGAGPNRSDAPRYAYVLIFQVPAEAAENPQEFPWLQNKNTARMQRSSRWLRQGGKYVNLWRAIRKQGSAGLQARVPEADQTGVCLPEAVRAAGGWHFAPESILTTDLGLFRPIRGLDVERALAQPT